MSERETQRETQRDSLGRRMSRAPASRSGRSGNPKIAGSSPESRVHGSNQTNDFKIDTCRFLARCSALLG